jgi:DNA repair ATPase RecN
MIKIIVSILMTSSLLFVVACNNDSGKSTKTASEPTRKAVADSLENEVIEGHNVVMPKSMKIPKIKKEAERLLDSISKLPARAQVAAAPMKARLQDLVKNLDSAYNSMEKWMEDFGHKMQEFNADSAKSRIEERIKFLSEQKISIGTVKEAVFNSLSKADSVLKTKF